MQIASAFKLRQCILYLSGATIMVEADVSVAVSVAGNRAHLAYLFCLRELGVEWRPFASMA